VSSEHSQARILVRALRTPALFAAALLFASLAVAQTPPADEPPETPEAERLLAEIDLLRAEYRALVQEQRGLEGEGLAVVGVQIRKQVFELIRTIDELVDVVVREREAGEKRPVGLRRTRKLLLEMGRRLPEFIDDLETRSAELRAAIPAAPEDVRQDLERRLEWVEEILDETFPFYVDHLGHRDALGLKAVRGRKQLEELATARAATLSGRVELLSQQRDEARNEAKETPGDTALAARLREVEEELDQAASSLWALCDVMDEIGLATAEYRVVLIEGTREITRDILDVDVLSGLASDAADAARSWLDRQGPALVSRAALFLIVLAIFWLLSRLSRGVVSRMTGRSEDMSELARRILVGTVSRTVFGLGLFVALSQVGVDVTALLAGLGIVGFIVGFALQSTLGNFASGAMILMYQPFDVGDVIEAAGVYGKVHGMNLVSTTILTFDNQTLVVPNSKIWGDVIRNVTAQDIRRVDLEFGLAHSVDVARAEEVLRSLVRDHPKVLEEPEPLIKVHKLTDSVTQFIVRPWTLREDYWDVYWDLLREAKLRLDREKIPLGIPRHEVQLHGETPD
jgi:small conductance mechanosensitive channel